jgi:WD40 repeat protein
LAFQPPLTKNENKGESSVIASASSDRSVRLWRFHYKYKEQEQSALAAALGTSSTKGGTKGVSTERANNNHHSDYTPRTVTRHHRAEVTSVAFSDDGHFMVSASLDSSVFIHQISCSFSLHFSYNVQCASLLLLLCVGY